MISPCFMASKASWALEMSMRREIMPVEVEAARLPQADEAVELGAHVGRAVVGAEELLLHEEELEAVELDHGFRSCPPPR